MTKHCTTCDKIKPLSDYNKVKGKPWYKCKECKHKSDRSYYHSEGGKEKIKAKRYKNLINIRKAEKTWRDKNPLYGKGKRLQKYWPESTWEEALSKYNELVIMQNNLCDICKKSETCTSPIHGKIRDLCVDHCHKTGKVRGLLCDDCNVLLGRAKDNIETCFSAAEYLKKTS